MLGGIKIPKHPPEHIIPDANFLSYPAFIIAGHARRPINVTTAPIMPEAVENTIAIAKRCSFMPKTLDPILPKFVSAGVDNEEADLRLKSFAGLEERFQENVFTMDSDEYSLEEKKKLSKKLYSLIFSNIIDPLKNSSLEARKGLIASFVFVLNFFLFCF